ncbi:hypothetical protein HDU76_011377 [Blyttiomyces sp. JEL0837]|nr:hypothetical protein HDU76_011377 [Blyttiomyces sp. JEL0837]
MKWHSAIKQGLKDRDDREIGGLGHVIDSYNSVLVKATALEERTNILQQQLDQVRSQYADASKALANLEEVGTPQAQKKFADIEEQNLSLKREIADLYKTQGQNAQRLVEALEVNRQNDASIKRQQEDLQDLTATNSHLSMRLRDALELIKEKDSLIQILKDELATHQLELVQREEQLRESNEKVRKLEGENRQLVERWMLLKQEEAKKMNEANEFVETALKTKQAVENKRQSSHPDVVLEGTMQDKRLPRCLPPNVAVKKVSAHDGDINCIQVSKDGSIVATGGNDKKLILFDARSGSVRGTLIGSLQGIMSAAFNADGELVLGTSNDNSAKIWSISTSRLRHTLTGHIGKVYSAKFTDSNRVISGSHDRTLKLWDLAKGYCVKTLFTLSSCNDLELLDGEGSMIVSGHLDNNLRVWDTRSGNLSREVSGLHSGQITSVNLSPNRNLLLTTSRDNTMKLIDIRTYEPVASFTHETFRVGMNWSKSCFSPDGNYVASGSLDGSLFIWNVESQAIEKVIKEHKANMTRVAETRGLLALDDLPEGVDAAFAPAFNKPGFAFEESPGDAVTDAETPPGKDGTAIRLKGEVAVENA